MLEVSYASEVSNILGCDRWDVIEGVENIATGGHSQNIWGLNVVAKSSGSTARRRIFAVSDALLKPGIEFYKVG